MTNLSARSPTETSDSFSAISSFVATEKVFGSVSVPMPVFRMTSVPTADTSSDERSVMSPPVTVIRLASRRAGKASTSACVVSVKFPS